MLQGFGGFRFLGFKGVRVKGLGFYGVTVLGV